MTDDLVKRLRDGCSCNIDSSPCMAEEECRDAYAAADRIEALEAKLAKAVEALRFYGGVMPVSFFASPRRRGKSPHHPRRTDRRQG